MNVRKVRIYFNIYFLSLSYHFNYKFQNTTNIQSLSYSGRACSGITFETDSKKWTPKRGPGLIVSANPEDKSILRSCYGKKILGKEFIS